MFRSSRSIGLRSVKRQVNSSILASSRSLLTRAIDTKVDETSYLLSSSAAPAAAPSQTNGSKKRAASPDASPAPTQSASQTKKPKIAENAQVGDGQNAKSKQIAISVDECCPLASYQVYIDNDGTIWDAALNQTQAGLNANKFYKIQVSVNLVLTTANALIRHSY
jgi:poly [ADP-ribose] polymerase